MKRLFLISAAILAALSFVSCQKDPVPAPQKPVFSHSVFEFNGTCGKDVMDNFTVTYNLEIDGKQIAGGEFTDPDKCSVKVEKGIDKGRLVFDVNFKAKTGFPELNREYDLSKNYECEVMSLDTAGGILDSGSHEYHSSTPDNFLLDDASQLEDFLEVIQDYLGINITFDIKADHSIE